MKHYKLWEELLDVLPLKTLKRLVVTRIDTDIDNVQNGYPDIHVPDIVADLLFDTIEGWDSLSKKTIQSWIEAKRAESR